MNWRQIASLLYTTSPQSQSGTYENVLLFSRNVPSNPCLLLGKNVISLASLLTRMDGNSSFALGSGQPTFYSWQRGNWVANAIPNADALAMTLQQEIGPQEFNVFYHLEVDSDLNVTRVVHIGVRNDTDRNSFTLIPTCTEGTNDVTNSSSVNRTTSLVTPLVNTSADPTMTSSNPPGPSNGWVNWYWLLILLLILLIIWVTFRSLRRSSLY